MTSHALVLSARSSNEDFAAKLLAALDDEQRRLVGRTRLQLGQIPEPARPTIYALVDLGIFSEPDDEEICRRTALGNKVHVLDVRARPVAVRFDPDPARTEAETIAAALVRSDRPEDIGLVAALRAGHCDGGRFSAQRAEDTLTRPRRFRPGEAHRVGPARRRGVQIGLVEDRVHLSFPLTALGRAVCAALATMSTEVES